MTDIVEQAARVLSTQTTCDGEPHPTELHRRQAQALADAGLLRDPARTVPTREEVETAIGGVLFNASNHPDPVTVLGKDVGPLREKDADAGLPPQAGQHTAAEVKAQAHEEAAELLDQPRALWFEFGIGVTVQDDTNRDDELTTWLRHRAQQNRDGK